jgi:O-antigen/teichoic acid export membrane protein
VTAGLSLLAAVVIVILANPLVRFVYGEAFAAAVPLVRVLAIGGAALSVQRLGAALLGGFGRPGKVAIAEAIGFVITLVGVLIWVNVSLTVVAAFAAIGSAVAALIEVVILRLRVEPADVDDVVSVPESS